VATALVAYLRLVELGKQDIAYATPLAAYAVARVREGRHVSSRLNGQDVMSVYAQQKNDIKVDRLDHFQKDEGVWKEILVEDKTVTPAELAASRIDFLAWLQTLMPRQRLITERLATGESTNGVARQFKVSPGRISQIRRRLQHAWAKFHGERNDHLTLATA
jgi:hypothetical protein